MTALKGPSHVALTYNGTAITNYTNSVDLQNTVAELEATHLGSTAEEADPGLPGHSLQIGGDWAAALDALLGADSMTGTKRTAVIAFDDDTTTVTYTWTSQAFVTGYNVQTTAQGKLEWSATLRLSGAGGRVVTP